MSLVGNETTKLPANALDRASTACLSVGVLAPVAGYLYDRGRFPVLYIGVVSYISVFMAGVLHLMARRMLRKLDE
jgi:1,4-dihydroxy-2-naphthoate octaprenyltransferase